mgnify:CR=1 FL=1
MIVGGGAREHALAAVLGRTAEVVVTPGNAGIPGAVDARRTGRTGGGMTDHTGTVAILAPYTIAGTAQA